MQRGTPRADERVQYSMYCWENTLTSLIRIRIHSIYLPIHLSASICMCVYHLSSIYKPTTKIMYSHTEMFVLKGVRRPVLSSAYL